LRLVAIPHLARDTPATNRFPGCSPSFIDSRQNGQATWGGEPSATFDGARNVISLVWSIIIVDPHRQTLTTVI
jgi:hypothetical protein